MTTTKQTFKSQKQVAKGLEPLLTGFLYNKMDTQTCREMEVVTIQFLKEHGVTAKAKAQVQKREKRADRIRMDVSFTINKKYNTIKVLVYGGSPKDTAFPLEWL